MNNSTLTAKDFLVGILVAVVGSILLIAIVIGLSSGIASYHRYQKRANASNQVKVTHIQIKTAKQQAAIVLARNAKIKALAEQRVIAAYGVAKAQKIINKTITPLYVELEAVEAQKAIATSGKNNTVIYVPSGTNGTPVITQNSVGSNPPQTTAP